jgi:NAD(P)-dependent dehydrogenase (short-subunit alcohol dehydrogenase family)
MKLIQTNILITGASRGLGEALARQLADKGANVVLVAREKQALDAVVDSLRAQGKNAHGIVADVSNKGEVYPLVGAAQALVGSIDVVIHNASTLGPLPMPLLAETSCEELAQVLETNLIGPFRITKALLGNMLLRQRGLVIHLTSDAAANAYPGWGAYGVSKLALEHMGRTFAAELLGSGISFWNIDPGEMNTKMYADALPDADKSTLLKPNVVAERIVSMIENAETIKSGSRLEAQG